MSDDPGDALGRWARNSDPQRDPITGAEVRARAVFGEPSPPAVGHHRRRWVLAGACAFLVVALGAAFLVRGGGDDVVVQTGPAAITADAGAQTRSTITVRLESGTCCFIEGFEVGLRFETADGEVLASTLWSDFVAESGATDIDAYYDSVLTQAVPSGTVVVQAEVAIGAGPLPVPPDLEGDLACRLDVAVEPGETVAVEVLFQDDDCLRLFDGTTTTTATVPEAGPTTSSPPTTAPPADDLPLTTTSIGALSVGDGQYVDVDLDCGAFELSGIWVLVEGDPRSWQPAGERHEGGTFTLDTPTTGRFVGDGSETKVATFRLLPAGEEPACLPLPR